MKGGTHLLLYNYMVCVLFSYFYQLFIQINIIFNILLFDKRVHLANVILSPDSTHGYRGLAVTGGVCPIRRPKSHYKISQGYICLGRNQGHHCIVVFPVTVQLF